MNVNVSLEKSEHPHSLQLSFHISAVGEAVYLVRKGPEKAPFHTSSYKRQPLHRSYIGRVHWEVYQSSARVVSAPIRKKARFSGSIPYAVCEIAVPQDMMR